MSSFHTKPLVPKGKHEGQTERIKVLICEYLTSEKGVKDVRILYSPNYKCDE
nr:MAG TPA: hypothetical protein [Caudoviricetes sp.]